MEFVVSILQKRKSGSGSKGDQRRSKSHLCCSSKMVASSSETRTLSASMVIQHVTDENR